MSSTNTIYSNIVDASKMDNIGLEVSWTGTPTGAMVFLVSNSGAVFSNLTFATAPTNPSGSASFYNLNLNQFPYKYLYIKYTNVSGSGVLSITGQLKDLN